MSFMHRFTSLCLLVTLAACAEGGDGDEEAPTDDATGDKPVDAGRRDSGAGSPLRDAGRAAPDASTAPRDAGAAGRDASMSSLDAGGRDGSAASKCEKVACMSPLECVFGHLDLLDCGFAACTAGFCAK